MHDFFVVLKQKKTCLKTFVLKQTHISSLYISHQGPLSLLPYVGRRLVAYISFYIYDLRLTGIKNTW